MAHAGPTFYADNAKALDIKEAANAHFREKEYQKALDLYSSIINQYDDRVMLDTIRVARCNRAACYLNLGEYQHCIDDCHIALLFMSTDPAISNKARYRLAKATKALDDIDAQKRAIDPSYPGRPKYDVEDRMREQMRESSASSAKFQPADVEEHRRVSYVVRMKSQNPEYVHMRDMVPASLMCAPPRGGREAYETRRDAFVKRVIATHEPELMQKHPWTCFSCGQPATTWLHFPISDLTSFYPIIKDYARPICANGGDCAKKTRDAMEKAAREDPDIAQDDGVRIKM
ncbi:hypothetical protein B0H17DRAFT_29072 [Mycena rosella]|uniref:TPR-like protein n=1 Tax=Mycena rosella TaxID=1033263 RepID=A0AAD7DBJ6_MYCRO|nr:hypothetical protein B0H17DRAFT_29072 [Mycena rosella]